MRIALAVCISILLLGCAAQEEAPAANGPVMEQPGPKLRTGHLVVPERILPDSMMAVSGEEEPPLHDFSRTHEDGELVVHFFYSPGCSACRAIIPEMDVLEDSYPDVLFLRYDLSTANGSEAYGQFALQHDLGSEEMYIPQVLVNGTVITDRFNINQSLEDIISSSSGAAKDASAS